MCQKHENVCVTYSWERSGIQSLPQRETLVAVTAGEQSGLCGGSSQRSALSQIPEQQTIVNRATVITGAHTRAHTHILLP